MSFLITVRLLWLSGWCWWDDGRFGVRGFGHNTKSVYRQKHICWKAESVCGEEDIFIAEGRQIQTEHRNLLGICCSTRIMLMISIVCAVGRRMSAKTTTAKSKKKIKILCAVQAHVVWMHVERFFRLLQFHSDEREKKIIHIRGPFVFKPERNEGMKLWWVSLLCCLKSVFFYRRICCVHTVADAVLL